MRERDAAEWAILGELVDVEPAEPGPVVLDDDDDFTFRDAEVSPPFGYDWATGEYYVEANSGPGWVPPYSSSAT